MLKKDYLRDILEGYYPIVPMKTINKMTDEVYDELLLEREEIFNSVIAIIDSKKNLLKKERNRKTSKKTLVKINNNIELLEVLKEIFEKKLIHLLKK